jgi:hypothetical protein
MNPKMRLSKFEKNTWVTRYNEKLIPLSSIIIYKPGELEMVSVDRTGNRTLVFLPDNGREPEKPEFPLG